jgi:dTDP-4-amino-4,6-dideoxygalactose transaminase
MKPIPLFDLHYGPRERDAVLRVLESKWLTQGDVTRRFETEFARRMGVKHAIAVSNCTAALYMAYRAMGIGSGDEILCPSLTFVATVNTILFAGGVPVFTEIRSLDDWTISPEDLESRIGPRTKGIVVMHYAGFPCRMEDIRQIARRHGLWIVEDCAHSPGSMYRDRPLGSFGDVSCFSFFSNKNIATGEGGMVCTGDDRIAEALRLIRSHGMTSSTLERHRGHSFEYDVVAAGFNFRMDEIRSALGLQQLERLEPDNDTRRKRAMTYLEGLEGVRQIQVPFLRHPGISNYHIFPVLLAGHVHRSDFMTRLLREGVQTSIHYRPVHTFTFYRGSADPKQFNLPTTEEVGRREVTLPMFPALTQRQVMRVCTAIKRYFKENP